MMYSPRQQQQSRASSHSPTRPIQMKSPGNVAVPTGGITRSRSSVRSTSITEPCCECQENKQTHICVQCNNDPFCHDCWAKQRAHRPGAVGMHGLPHEKTNRQVADRLRDILEPKRTVEQQQILHRNDEDTTWFGIARDTANLPIFQDYGRYGAIMSESQTVEVNVRYPQLVSFIGQTGAGKSTLIKMLIEKQEGNNMQQGPRFSSPVTGATNDNLPTSGDVHLYSDPTTYWNEIPLLYADCEGLDGGENVPHGARFKLKDGVARPSSRASSSANDPQFKKKVRKAANGSKRDITWATTPETRKREYAVTQLYPRLLYTFSDAVVFVLRNSKVFESVVLEKLLDWASASIEHSVNQPALPHAIIALNASEIVPYTQQWDVKQATDILMSDIAGAIERVPRFQEYAQVQRQRGNKIKTAKDLLLCYYSSITVVRIPTHGRYMLMDEQVGKLHAAILKCCAESLIKKKQVRMLSNGEMLQIYLQSAFDHFSRDLDSPFDFVKEAIKANPIPRDFRGNILKLAIAIRDHKQFPRDPGPRIFQELSHMVASCVLLDIIRTGLLGTAEQVFNEFYIDFCEDALEEFCNAYWPCSFEVRGSRCILVKSGHNQKGHQNAEGKIIAAGEYKTDFYAEDYSETWIANLRRNLYFLERDLQIYKSQKPQKDEQGHAARLHRDKMNQFYINIGDAWNFQSHSTCFSCLRELPEHPLPCGHVLCTPCVKAYGHKSDKIIVQLTSCPLHDHQTQWARPWKISIKPPYAGVRVLCLDGGGVRGIVELEVLRAIEKRLGGEMPIQAFFDLIVGTSTGGIIALGLGVENWSVESCIIKFRELVNDAFTPRLFHNIWGLEHLEAVIHRSKYKTAPFEEALQEAFSPGKALFSGKDDKESFMNKVAVTSTTQVDQQPVLLTNYNRQEPQGFASYKFERADHPALEIRTWEAARATSAAPPYFKTFIKQQTKNGYLDGALYHNNPISVAHNEMKSIWSDVSGSQPDIVLSIGTGQDAKESRNLNTVKNGFLRPTGITLPDKGVRDGPMQSKKFPTFTEQLWHTVASRFDHIMNCNRIWETFCTETLEQYSTARKRYIRINPDFNFQVPRLDDVSQIHNMEKFVHERMLYDPKPKEVAHRLVASTFFFEKVDVPAREARNEFRFNGYICCRFSSDIRLMKELGKFIANQRTPTFTPYFTIMEQMQWDTSKKIPISDDSINDMVMRGKFDGYKINVTISAQLAQTVISLCLQEGSYMLESDLDLPISGFPRALMVEDSLLRTNSRGLTGHNGNSLRRHQRRRRLRPTLPSGDNNPESISSLRRVRSQSNLRSAEFGTSRSLYPEGPDDIDRWRRSINRSNTVNSSPHNELNDSVTHFATPAEIHEMADTSWWLPSSAKETHEVAYRY